MPNYVLGPGYEAQSMSDAVHQPSHYTQGAIETIDYIRDTLMRDEFVGYCTGNTHKYTRRGQVLTRKCVSYSFRGKAR